MEAGQPMFREVIPMPALAVRVQLATADLGQLLPEVDRVQALAERRGITLPGPVFLRHFHQDVYRSDVEIGLFLSEAVEGEGDIYPLRLPTGHVATLLFRGRFSDVPEAAAELTRWAEALGRRTQGPVFEILVGAPDDAEDTAVPETLLILPLESDLD